MLNNEPGDSVTQTAIVGTATLIIAVIGIAWKQATTDDATWVNRLVYVLRVVFADLGNDFHEIHLYTGAKAQLTVSDIKKKLGTNTRTGRALRRAKRGVKSSAIMERLRIEREKLRIERDKLLAEQSALLQSA